MEHFVDMKEGNGGYEISNQGRIRSNTGNTKILKQRKRRVSDRHFVINLYDNNIMTCYCVGNLMKKYFPDVVLRSEITYLKNKIKVLEKRKEDKINQHVIPIEIKINDIQEEIELAKAPVNSMIYVK